MNNFLNNTKYNNFERGSKNAKNNPFVSNLLNQLLVIIKSHRFFQSITLCKSFFWLLKKAFPTKL